MIKKRKSREFIFGCIVGYNLLIFSWQVFRQLRISRL